MKSYLWCCTGSEGDGTPSRTPYNFSRHFQEMNWKFYQLFITSRRLQCTRSGRFARSWHWNAHHGSSSHQH